MVIYKINKRVVHSYGLLIEINLHVDRDKVVLMEVIEAVYDSNTKVL